MMTKRHFIMLAFTVLALGPSFTFGWAANPSMCDPADCATACKVMTAEECEKVCPPECIILCEEICAEPSATAAGLDCGAGFDFTNCSMGSQAAGSMAVIDPAGQLSFRLATGQGAEIVK